MIDNLAACAVHLDRVCDETGRAICLALEPEPDCYLETTDESITFFEEHLLRQGVRSVATAGGVSLGRAEEVVRKHIGVCFDTCHMSLQFEDVGESFSRLQRHGVSVPKVQLSSAVSVQTGHGGPSRLLPFVDEVYLHQVKERGADGVIRSYDDLTPALIHELTGHGGSEVRAHFHVPLYFVGDGELGSTAGSLTDAFFRMILKAGSCLEIETYTYDVLPAELRARDVALSIADEYRWVLEKIPDRSANG